MGSREFDHVQALALGFPGVNQRMSHRSQCFYIRDTRPLCYFHEPSADGDGRSSIWCPAPAGVPEELAAADPTRFFRPTPSASGTFSGWLGVYLDALVDTNDDWNEIGRILEDAFREIAPKKLVADLDG